MEWMLITTGVLIVAYWYTMNNEKRKILQTINEVVASNPSLEKALWQFGLLIVKHGVRNDVLPLVACWRVVSLEINALELDEDQRHKINYAMRQVLLALTNADLGMVSMTPRQLAKMILKAIMQ